MGCLKAKNSNSYCSSEARNRANPKKYSQPAKKVQLTNKKSFLGFRGFRTCFWEVDHPLCDVWKQKTQILIAHQKEGIDRTQKSPAIRQKKFGQGLEDFAPIFRSSGFINFCLPKNLCTYQVISNITQGVANFPKIGAKSSSLQPNFFWRLAGLFWVRSKNSIRI